MTNLAFRRALMALSHPISIAALIVVLLNDHWWRRIAPSWLTGKIGDFAWLTFAPFLLAALLAWLWPKRAMFVGRVSIIGTGAIFALAKTVPAFHALTIKVLETLTGWPNILRMDATDVIALPALLIAWWIWDQSPIRSIHLPKRGWVLLPLAVFTTMADSGMPFAGLDCLQASAGQILVADAFSSYVSRDGGLSWMENVQTENTQRRDRQECGRTPREMFNPDNPLVRFRLTSGQIEQSSDGGLTWQTEYAKVVLSQAQEVYARRTTGRGFPVLVTSPSVVLDSITGNLIVTAGHQGVRVRTPDGKWHAIRVGPYLPIDFHQPGLVVALLAGEELLALVVFMLASGTLTPGRTSKIVRALLVLGWLGLLGTFGCILYFWQSGYGQVATLVAIGAGVIAAPIAVIRLFAAFRLNSKVALTTIGLSALTALLFLLPFVVWSQNGLPFYNSAMLYALVLVAVTLIAGRAYLKRLQIAEPGIPVSS